MESPLPPLPPPNMSIKQLTRMYCRERILVAPLYWTSRHLELLQCSFTGPFPAPPTTQSDFTGERNGRRFIGRMVRHWNSIGRDHAIEDLVSSSDCPLKPGKDLGFFFDSRACALLKCVSLHDRCEAERCERPPPIAAYLDRDRIHGMRRDVLYPKLHRSRGEFIALALYRRKIKSITPPDPVFEPYIAAVLIAIAQEQQRAVLKRAEPQAKQESCTSTFSARVLASSLDKECMHLYSADITSSFLDKLNNPAVSPLGPTPVSIRITTIPYKPYKSLRDRVFALLLPPHRTGIDREHGAEDKGIGCQATEHGYQEMLACS